MGRAVSSERLRRELGSEALVAHNSFLSVLVEEGLVGLMLYLAMMLSVFLTTSFTCRLWSEGSGSSS